jgi:hypothetical protein
MTDKARIKIAAAVTALFLAAVSLAGIATRVDVPKPASAAPAPVLVQQPTTAPPASPAAEYGDREEGEHYD